MSFLGGGGWLVFSRHSLGYRCSQVIIVLENLTGNTVALHGLL